MSRFTLTPRLIAVEPSSSQTNTPTNSSWPGVEGGAPQTLGWGGHRAAQLLRGR